MNPTLLDRPDALCAAIAETLRVASLNYDSMARIVTAEVWACRLAQATGTHRDEWRSRVRLVATWLGEDGGERAALDGCRGICDRAAEIARLAA